MQRDALTRGVGVGGYIGTRAQAHTHTQTRAHAFLGLTSVHSGGSVSRCCLEIRQTAETQVQSPIEALSRLVNSRGNLAGKREGDSWYGRDKCRLY